MQQERCSPRPLSQCWCEVTFPTFAHQGSGARRDNIEIGGGGRKSYKSLLDVIVQRFVHLPLDFTSNASSIGRCRVLSKRVLLLSGMIACAGHLAALTFIFSAFWTALFFLRLCLVSGMRRHLTAHRNCRYRCLLRWLLEGAPCISVCPPRVALGIHSYGGCVQQGCDQGRRHAVYCLRAWRRSGHARCKTRLSHFSWETFSGKLVAN